MHDFLSVVDASNVLSLSLGLVIGYAVGRMRRDTDQALHDAREAIIDAQEARQIAEQLKRSDDNV